MQSPPLHIVRHTCAEENTLVHRCPVEGEVDEFKHESKLGARRDREELLPAI